MPEYQVSHVITVVADTPAAAAEAARAAQIKAGELATVFEVAERLPNQRLGPPIEIDLEPGDLDKLNTLMRKLSTTARPCDHGDGVRRPVELCECGMLLAHDAVLATVGMPDLEPEHPRGTCRAECHPVGECTREAGHPGQHVAGDGETVIGVADGAGPW